MTNKDGFKITYVNLIYVAVFFVYYILFLNQALEVSGPLGNFASETRHHMDYSQPLLHKHWLRSFKTLQINFEPLLHILTAMVARCIKFISGNNETMNLANAIAFVLSFAKLAQFIIVKKIVKATVHLSEGRTLFLTTVINFCTVLYLPFISFYIYMPMITPNMLVDPTNIFLLPLAILFFYLYIKNYVKAHSQSFKRTFLLSLLLIAATLAKPAFTNIILVVMGVYYVLHPKRFISTSLLHDLILYLPSCLILIGQILLITNSSSGGGIEFAPYKVIGLFTSHPFIALFQGVEFPLLITGLSAFLIRKKLSVYLSFAWVFCIISYLIYALFSFMGPSWTAANLAWSYQIGLALLYLFIIIEYGKLFLSGPTKISGFWMNLCAINFGLIFLSGIHQFVKIYLGGFYF